MDPKHKYILYPIHHSSILVNLSIKLYFRFWLKEKFYSVLKTLEDFDETKKSFTYSEVIELETLNYVSDRIIFILPFFLIFNATHSY